MKHLYYGMVVIGLLLSSSAIAQISQGGEPERWSQKDLQYPVNYAATPEIDLELARAQDEVTDQYKETPYRFGIEQEVDLDVIRDGAVESGTDGKIYRLGIECPNALSVSFTFDQFFLPKGAKIFVFNEERDEFLGAFTHKNNKEWGSFAVGIVHGDRIVIEFHEPANVEGLSALHINQVVHGYRPILNKFTPEEEAERGPFGTSGACNINVNCPEGAEWSVEKRSVALIVNGGFAQCSGALVNNTAQDGTPYFLTANHCLGGQNNWVFYFNHETSGCTGSTGPTNQSISGSTLRASNGGSDFALLELSSTPPANFNAEYAGWDNTDATNVTSAVGIHHPSGDVKKICFENNAPFHQNTAGAAVWYINQWEDGVTEGGSSGSPLFNQAHRIIGQLYGGFAACSGTVNNGQADWYGRFGVSWDGNSSSTRLRDWLDPLNTGQTVLDGWPTGAVSYTLDAAVSPGNNDYGTICGDNLTPSVTIYNQGTDVLTSLSISYSLNGTNGNIDWTGNLAQYESETISLPSLGLNNGTNNLNVSSSNPNGGVDENTVNDSFSQSIQALTGNTYPHTFALILDDYGSETTWEVRQGNNLLFSGGPYGDGLDGTPVDVELCLSEGCYTFTIFDGFGDGICCGWGTGSYQILNQNNVAVVSSTGEFTDDESHDFCVTATNINEIQQQAFRIYPNPSNGLIKLGWNQKAEQAGIEVIDAAGRIVFSTTVNTASGTTSLDLSALSKGLYTLRASGTNWQSAERLVIQ